MSYSLLNLQLVPAEVKEVIYSDASPNLIYGIKAKIIDSAPVLDTESTSVITATPLNQNVLRIPIVGEVVLLLRAPSSYATSLRTSENIYYVDIVNLQNSVHQNGIPTVTKFTATKGSASGNSDEYNETSSGNTRTEQEPVLDTKFVENPTAKPIQHYIGDVLISGRYGHGLRFTSSTNATGFAVPPKFSNSVGNPITILRNTKQSTNTNKINDFVTETFTTEENVLVMASGQNLEFEQSSKVLTVNNSKNITSWKDENWGTTPQTLLSAGRIIFNSTQKEIIAFAKNGIGLSTETSVAIDAKNDVAINASKIELGANANEPLILGNQWKLWMDNLITALSTLTVTTAVGPSLPLIASPQWATIESLRSQLTSNSLLSDSVFTKKKTTTSGGARSTSNLPEPNFKMSEQQVAQAAAQRDDAQQRYQNPALTPAEKKSIADLHNLKEKEVKNTSFVNSKLDNTTFTTNDVESNAQTLSKSIYAGPVNNVDGDPPPSLI